MYEHISLLEFAKLADIAYLPHTAGKREARKLGFETVDEAKKVLEELHKDKPNTSGETS